MTGPCNRDSNRLGGSRERAASGCWRNVRKKEWKNLDDFRLRCGLKKDEARVLAKIGALNGLAPHRREALWRVEKPLEDDLFHWGGLFEGQRKRECEEEEGAPLPEETAAIPLAPMSRRERLQADYAALGLTVGAHPMALVRPNLPHVRRANDLASGKDAERSIGSLLC